MTLESIASNSSLRLPHDSSWFLRNHPHVRLSGNLGPLNAATHFPMITVEITVGRSNDPSGGPDHFRSSSTDVTVNGR